MTNQSDQQQSIRNVTATALNYEGDWHALWDSLGISSKTFNERMLEYINLALNTSYTELNGAMAAYAIANGVSNWNSLGTFTPGPYPFAGSSQAFNFAGTTGLTPLAGSPMTFSRGTNATMYRSGDGWAVFAPNNMLTYSSDFSKPAWAKTGTPTLTPSNEVPPLGTPTVYEFNQGPDTSGSFFQNSFSIVAGQMYTQSFYIKAGGSNPTTTVYIALGSGGLWPGSVLPSAVYNLITNEITAVASSVYSTNMVTQSDGSKILTITAIATAGGSSAARIFTFNTNRTFLIGGAQVEVGPYAQKYNSTTATPYYGPVLDTNPTTITPRGLRYEPSKTNLLLWGNDLSNAVWSKSASATITPNASIGADGLTSMDMVTEATVNDSVDQQVTVIANNLYTQSVDLKRGNCDWIMVLFYDPTSTSDQVRLWVNLATGTLGVVSTGGAATVATATIIALPNSIYRVSLSGIFSPTATSVRARLKSASGNGSTTGVAGATYYVGRQQFELGNGTSFIPTFSATATRGADVETFDASTIFNASEGTIYCEFELDQGSSGLDLRPFTIGDGSANNRIQINRNASNQLSVIHVAGGVTGSSFGFSGPFTSGVVKIAIGYTNAGTIRVAVNGALNTAASFNSPAVTTGYFSNYQTNTGAYWNRKFAYYRNGMTSTQLQAMTS
jgi:hypothetical protein